MARSYKYQDPVKEANRLLKQAKKIANNTKYMQSEKIDWRRKDTYAKIKNAVYGLTGGVVFDPHKKRKFDELLEDEVSFKNTARQFKKQGAKTLSDFTFAILNQLGIELSQLQAETIAENINSKYIQSIKNQKAGYTLEQIRQMDYRDDISTAIKNIMCQYSSTVEEFYAFELKPSDILGLTSKWIALQSVIELNDLWDEMFS